jgi:hypothetical protein
LDVFQCCFRAQLATASPYAVALPLQNKSKVAKQSEND